MAHRRPAAVALGFEEYERLKAECLAMVAEFVPCAAIPLSIELDRLGIPHFFCAGILVLRGCNQPIGYIFL